MENKVTEISYTIYKNKGVFALLLGSGISSNAGIPTGWQIMLKLITEIAILEKQSIPLAPEIWYKSHFGIEPDYSKIIDQLSHTKEERINLLKSFFEPEISEIEENLKRPTVTHQKIAELVKLGYIKVIITTNFDRLLENALKDLGIEPVVISNPAHIENTSPIVHNKITIFKVNGDYLDTKFLNIKSELEQYDKRLIKELNYIFENFGLLTCVDGLVNGIIHS